MTKKSPFGPIDKMTSPMDAPRAKVPPKAAPPPVPPPKPPPKAPPPPPAPPPKPAGRSQLVRPPPVSGNGFGIIPTPKEPPKPPPTPMDLDDDPTFTGLIKRRSHKTRMNRGKDPLLELGGRGLAGRSASDRVFLSNFLEAWQKHHRQAQRSNVAPSVRTWGTAVGPRSGTRVAPSHPSQDPNLTDKDRRQAELAARRASEQGGGAPRSWLDIQAGRVRSTDANIVGGQGVVFDPRNIDPTLIPGLAQWARKLWRKKAMSAFRGRGTALNDYLRAMRVDIVAGRLRLWLEGWEALAREVGWAPHPGGLSAGLGEYTGQPVDLKKIMLGGAAYKVIPLRIEGTSKDIAQSVQQAVKKGMLTYEGGEMTPRAAKKYGKAVNAAGGSREFESDEMPENHPFGPGRGDRRGRQWEKSIFEDAIPIKPLGGGQKKSSAFVTFRTMSDPDQMKDKRKAARQRRKWITKGIAPMNLIKEVQAEVIAFIKSGSA